MKRAVARRAARPSARSDRLTGAAGSAPRSSRSSRAGPAPAATTPSSPTSSSETRRASASPSVAASSRSAASWRWRSTSTGELLTLDPPAGVEIVSWAERPELVGGLYEVYLEGSADIPSEEDVEIQPLDDWLAGDMSGVGDRPEWTFVAVAGDEVVGYSKGSLTTAQPHTAHHDLTAVKRSWRPGDRRRVKSAQLTWAKENGYTRAVTNNEERNAPIRRLNERFGYLPAGGRILMRGPLRRGEMKYMVMMFGDASEMRETRSTEWIREMIDFMLDVDGELRKLGEPSSRRGSPIRARRRLSASRTGPRSPPPVRSPRRARRSRAGGSSRSMKHARSSSPSSIVRST